MTSPRIGITMYVEDASWGVWSRPAAVLPTAYLDLVRAGGGTPILLPPVPGHASDAAAAVDGLILAGGPDVDPARYGHEAGPRTGVPRTERDQWEFELLDVADRDGLPVLAVCRGMQLLNVARGGTLHQHTPDVLGTSAHQPSPAVFAALEADVVAETTAHRLLGPTRAVRCYHHQSIDALGRDLVVAARTPDGSIEAVEDPTHPFLLGVQWHPEEQASDTALVDALVAAALIHAGRTS